MRFLEIITFGCFTTVAAASVLAPPPNDNCTTPIVLAAPGTFAFDTTMATNTTGITNGFCPARGRDIWYAWTATAVGTASFQTCGLTTFDTNIAVFSNGPCPTGAPLTCDDDACGLESFVSWTTVVGTTYRLQLGSSGGGPGGTGSFTLSFVGPPANDNCATPDIITSGSTIVFYDNSSATTGTQGQANTCGTNPKKDLWYRWTARQNGSATLDTCFQTSQDTSVAVYAGPGCPVLTAVACNDNDPSCTPQSSVTWSITAGNVYTLQIGGPISDPGGAGSFTITETGTSTGIVFCQGDGAHTACPCANNSAAAANAGCLNSMAVGGRLRGSGSASIASDSFLLTATQVPNGPGIFSQGTAEAAVGGNGVVLGDGLLCIGGTIIRMGIVFASSNTSTFPSGPFSSISVVGGVAPGNSRFYQLWYRDSAVAFCPPATNNLTNGVALTWAP